MMLHLKHKGFRVLPKLLLRYNSLSLQAAAASAAAKGVQSMTLEEFKQSLAEIDKGLRPFPATAQARIHFAGQVACNTL